MGNLWIETVAEFYPRNGEDDEGGQEKGPDQLEQFREAKIDELIKQRM